MATRRDFLVGLLGAGAMGLVAACGGGSGAAGGGGGGGGNAPAGGGAAATTAPAAASKPAGGGGSITFALEDDPINFDPLLSNAFIDRNVHYQIYDSLVRIDANGKIIPWLAEKWDISQDGKTVTFNLRKGVKYHDGTDFDAESVKWNIERYLNTDGSFRKGELAPVASVDAVDAATVRFSLKSTFSPFLSLLVDRAGMMVSRKAVEAGGQDFTRKAFKAGTGPYMLTEAVKDDHITLEKNPEWWGDTKPSLDKITIKPIKDPTVRLTNVRTGNADIMNNIAGKDVAAAKNESSLTYAGKPGLAFDSFIPNRKEGFVFSEPRYVKAVSMAIDRQEIMDKVFLGSGTVGYGTIAPAHFAYDPNFKPFEKADPEGAKQLVQQVGKGALSFELLVPSSDSQQLQLAQLLQAQLKKADIDVQLTQLEFAQILKQQTDHVFTGMSQVGWSGRIDPDGNTYDHIYTGRPFNDSSYSNKDVDALLDQERQTNDEGQRKDAFRKAEQMYVVDDPARVWYRFRPAEILATNKLKGVQVYPDQIIRFHELSMG